MSGFTVDLSGLTALRQVVRDFGEKVKEDVAMAGAAAGAKAMYLSAKMHAPESDEAHTFYGRNSKKNGVTYTFLPGNLKRSIYRAFREEVSGPTLKSYRISWNHFKAPYGHMVEFGTSRAAAHPFLGAALSEFPQAYRYAKEAMADELQQIVRRR